MAQSDNSAEAAFKATLLQAGMVTKADGLTILEHCMADHAAEMAAKAVALMPDPHYWSACSTHEWLAKLQEIGDPAEDRNFIDIGCNKGYTSAHFFRLFTEVEGFTPQAIYKWRQDTTVNKDAAYWEECGACKDCEEQIEPLKQVPEGAPRGKVEVVCVEPSLTAYSDLIRLRATLSLNQNQQWHLVNAAVSNGTERHVSFPRCKSGLEICSFDIQADAQWVVGRDLLPLYGVDELIAMYGFEKVDVLKLDTEGFDMLGLASAQNSLLNRKIRALVFEYHEIGLWPRFKLQDVVKTFDGLNFACYYTGKPGPEGAMVRLTGCWNDQLEFHKWSNVFCVRRDQELYPHVERLSMRYAIPKYRSLYYEDENAAAGAQNSNTTAAGTAA